MDKKDHAIAYLISTYPGVEAWQRYAAECMEEWEERADRDYFSVFFQDNELAAVLARHFDKHAFDWFDSSEIPALYGFSPRQVWLSGESGRDSLRSMLMRTPWRK